MAETQESRTERVSLAVTPREKRALEFVASVRDLPASSYLLRDLSLTEVIAEFDRRLARLRKSDPDLAEAFSTPRTEAPEAA